MVPIALLLSKFNTCYTGMIQNNLSLDLIQSCPDYFVNGPANFVKIMSMILYDSLNLEYH